MAAGDYIPKYKMGYTLLSGGEDTHYIVISTYRGMGQFSRDFAEGHPDYDERDKDHVLYVVYDPANRQVCWRWENVVGLYCCNPNRGKKIMVDPNNFKRICNNYSMSVEGIAKLKAELNHQPPDT